MKDIPVDDGELVALQAGDSAHMGKGQTTGAPDKMSLGGNMSEAHSMINVSYWVDSTGIQGNFQKWRHSHDVGDDRSQAKLLLSLAADGALAVP